MRKLLPLMGCVALLVCPLVLSSAARAQGGDVAYHEMEQLRGEQEQLRAEREKLRAEMEGLRQRERVLHEKEEELHKRMEMLHAKMEEEHHQHQGTGMMMNSAPPSPIGH